MNDSGDHYEPLLEYLREMAKLVRHSPNLRGHEEEGVRTLRFVLRKSDLDDVAFRYLAATSLEFTIALIDDLLYIAGSDRYTLNVAELLGRLSYKNAKELVPPAVDRRLEADDVDYGDWFRMADVLNYLGLYDALRELVARARDHIDGDVRELADTYGDV